MIYQRKIRQYSSERTGRQGDLHVIQESIIQSVDQLDIFSAMGPDELQPYFSKSCIEQIVYPQKLIYPKSYLTSRLPSMWKSSLVVAIFKKGSCVDPLMHRSVSLSSKTWKNLERIILKLIYDYVQDNNLLSHDQCGFRPGRSTEDQLLLTYEYNAVTLALGDGKVADLILSDYTKAFDAVSHNILLDKLLSLDITGKVLLCVKDFITGRTMKAVMAHAKDSTKLVFSGVPQGSVLGPLQFLL